MDLFVFSVLHDMRRNDHEKSYTLRYTTDLPQHDVEAALERGIRSDAALVKLNVRIDTAENRVLRWYEDDLALTPLICCPCVTLTHLYNRAFPTPAAPAWAVTVNVRPFSGEHE